MNIVGRLTTGGSEETQILLAVLMLGNNQHLVHHREVNGTVIRRHPRLAPVANALMNSVLFTATHVGIHLMKLIKKTDRITRKVVTDRVTVSAMIQVLIGLGDSGPG